MTRGPSDRSPPTPRAQAVARGGPLTGTLALAASLALVLGAARAGSEPAATMASSAAAPSVVAAAAPDQLRVLFDALEGHPALRAVDALADAAARRLAAVRAPLSLSGQVDVRRLRVEPASDPLPPPLDELFEIDDASETYSVRLVLRPFLFGDLADLGDQRRVEAERADLQARETRAALEVQAVQAALGVWLADLGVALAEDGLALSELAAAGTLRRAEAGGASALEVGRAELALREAAAAVRDARRQRELAAARAASLVGDARLDGPFDLLPVAGLPPDVARAMLDVALADVGRRNAERAFLPTVQAGYAWLFDDGGTLSLGLESRTLQPALSYASGGAGGTGGGLADLAPEGVAPTVRGALSVSIAWSFSPQAYLEADAARYQRDAAEAGLAAAEDRARLTQAALEAALASAEARLSLAELERELAELERDAVDARFAAGAVSELERLAAHLALAQARWAHARARVDRLAAVLDSYATYAIPLSEVLP